MPAIEVDKSEWPLVKIRFPREPLTDLALRSYLSELSEIGAEGRSYAIATDLSPMQAHLTASQRLLFDEWMRSNIAQLERLAVGNALIVSTPVSRGVAETAYWHWRDPPMFRLFRREQAAHNWCRWRIHRLAEGRRRRRVPTRPPPQRSIPMAGVIDLFSEPAFLVAPCGEEVFANRAAREFFPPPRPWLRAAVSHGTGHCNMPLQITRVSMDGRELNLVVVGEGAAFASMPPRLFEIARLISDGNTDKEIASATGLAPTSVRTYVRRLYARAGVSSRAELVRMWFLRPRR